MLYSLPEYQKTKELIVQVIGLGIINGDTIDYQKVFTRTKENESEMDNFFTTCCKSLDYLGNNKLLYIGKILRSSVLNSIFDDFDDILTFIEDNVEQKEKMVLVIITDQQYNLPVGGKELLKLAA